MEGAPLLWHRCWELKELKGFKVSGVQGAKAAKSHSSRVLGCRFSGFEGSEVSGRVPGFLASRVPEFQFRILGATVCRGTTPDLEIETQQSHCCWERG